MHSFSRRISLFHYVLNYMSVSAFHRDHHPHRDTFFIFLLKDNLHTPKCIYHNYTASCHFPLCSWSYTLSLGRASLPFLHLDWVFRVTSSVTAMLALHSHVESCYSQRAPGHSHWEGEGEISNSEVPCSKVLLPPLTLTRLGFWAPRGSCSSFLSILRIQVSALECSSSWFWHIP